MFLSICAAAAALMISAAAALVVWRMWRGPGLLDRVVSLDVLVTAFIGAVVLEMVRTGTTDLKIVLLILSVIGWISSVAFAVFLVSKRKGLQ